MKKKTRNPFAISSRKRKGGKMCSKKDKRQNSKNKVKSYLQEEY